MANNFDKGQILFYELKNGKDNITVHLADETVWLTLNQMAEIFDRDKSVISRHLRNVFQTGELTKEATVAKNATVQNEGGREVTRNIEWFNLDVIISVGYRVNSKRGTQFRIWATSILKDHLVKGYTLNQRRLAEKGILEAQQVLSLLTNTLENQNLVSDEGRSVLNIVNQYAKTWQLLLQYDEDNLPPPNTRQVISRVLDVDHARKAINSLKEELLAKQEATDLFGNERSEALQGIIGAIQQTFGGEDLYPSIEEKSANLLYFVIKDHPFTDGNKRIGTFLFLLFLQINGQLGEKYFDNKALVALTLLIAASDPAQKDLLIRLIVNLLSGE
ncbi:MAG: virulence RhuM family protein [Desulfocapsa sp.]|nr:virulence RhuM family protein [Desulfocapsa sp.]